MSRALVLSGGGPVGIAWQTGLAAGLARKGVTLADAQYILGTSAGSVVGAQLALGRDLEAQVARYESAGAAPFAPPKGTGVPGAGAPGEGIAKLMAMMADATRDASSETETRQAIGRFALEADTIPEDRFVDVFGYLAGEPWPERFRCTAVEAETGEFRVWDHEANVDLDRAVASSCAVPGIFPPITLSGRRYIDGGMRSGANLDLAAGHDRVVLITLMGPERLRAMAGADDSRVATMLARTEAEFEAVRDAGGVVEVLAPDDDSANVMGINLMDASLGPAAAAAGAAQGERAADQISDFWSA